MTTSSTQNGHQPPGSFVGREPELAELRAALEETSMRRGLFLISGEPGIGKTRLADELATEARARGFRVLWGRCWEGGGTPAYWPFIQIVRACLESIESDRRGWIPKSETTAQVAAEVAKIVPELLPAHGGEPPASKSLDTETARFLLFDAVASFLKTLAHKTPMLIVVDDLHDADLASLSMLGFVAREVHDANLLIVGTYRDVELHRSPERLKLVQQILHEGHQLPLAGLGESEVGHMVESRAGRPVSEALVGKIHWLTGANPLFIDGAVRVLAAERKPTPVKDLAGIRLPDNVGGAIAHRLAMLSEEVRAVLEKAAVIGQEFELNLLARINELGADALTESVRQALEVGIISPTTRDLFRFTHPLIREALLKGQKESARIATHHAIGVALEQLHGTDLTPHLAELAHHFREAGIVKQAIDYSIRAGDAANAIFACQEAADQFQAALDLMEKNGVDAERRAGLLERLASTRFSFDEAGGVANLEQSLRLYEEAHRTDRLIAVNTTLAVRRFTPTSMLNLPKGLEHFRKAEAALVEAPSERARFELHQAMTIAAGRSLRIGEGLEASGRAIEIAGRLNNRRLSALLGSQRALLLCYAGRWAEGFGLLDEACRTADALNDQGLLYAANTVLTGMTGWLQDVRTMATLAQRELAKPRTAHATFHQAFYNGNLHVALAAMGRLAEAKLYRFEGTDPMVALYEGRWEDAERQWAAYLDWLANAGGRAESNGHFLHLALVRRLQRKHSLAEAQLLDAISLCRGEALLSLEMLVRPEIALLYADMNRHAEAEPHVERCREIMLTGEDWRGLAGFVARAEGVVAAAEGRREEAEQAFIRAENIFRRYILPWEEAENFFHWGRALLAAGESARAIEKFDAAIEIYRSHGAGTRFVEYVMADKMRVQGSTSTDAEVQSPSTDSVRANAPAPAPQLQAPTSNDRNPGDSGVDKLFRREGDIRAITHTGQTLHRRDFKGLSYGRESQRVVATLLFIDIVSSTEHVTKLRDRRWVELRRGFFELIRKQLASFNGLEIDAAGDGMLAIFDHPAAAIHCAFAMSQGVEKLGLQMRAGIHTGECELVGGDAIGIAVHIGARVASQAAATEVLVSSTVRDLLAGGDIRFVDRGTHVLKGVVGEWHLYAAQQPE